MFMPRSEIDRPNMTPPKNIHPADVKAALAKRGLTLADVARTHGYDLSSPGKALRMPWPQLRRVIAAYLGRTPQSLWPEDYDSRGEPRLRERASSKAITLPDPVHVDFRKAG